MSDRGDPDILHEREREEYEDNYFLAYVDDHGGYPLKVPKVGGREPDGSPTFIGKWTFQARDVRLDVLSALQNVNGRVLNACAGKTKLNHGTAEIVRNDLNPEIDADFHLDVESIDEEFTPRSFDGVIFDPPFSQEQAEEHYDGMHARKAGPARKALASLVRPGGVFVELGWNLYGPADEREGWTREWGALYRRGPAYQPVFLVVDRNAQQLITEAA